MTDRWGSSRRWRLRAVGVLMGAMAAAVSLAPSAAGNDVSALRWSDVRVAAFKDNWISDVASTPEGFLAVGFGSHDYAFIGDRTARRWEAVVMPPNGPTSPFEVAVGRAGVVATGGVFEGTGPSGSWWSRDGRSWETTELGERGDLGSVVATDDGFLATGGRDVGGAYVPTAWTSRDGRSWTEIEDPSPGIPEGRVLVQTPLGLFTLASDVGVATVLRRVGSEWESTSVAIGGATDLKLAHAGRSLLLIGSDCPAEPCALDAWRSDDGRSWQSIPLSLAVSTFEWELHQLPGRLVVEDWVGGRLWMTRDGERWESVPSPAGPDRPMHFVEGHGRIVATTFDRSDVIWVARADGAPDTATSPPATPASWAGVPVLVGVAAFVLLLVRLPKPAGAPPARTMPDGK